MPLEAGVTGDLVVFHKDFSHSVHCPLTQLRGDVDVAGTIDDDFTVDPQEAMRGVGVCCVGWLHSRVDWVWVWFDFQTLLSGKRRRRREQDRQNDCACVALMHTVRAPRLFQFMRLRLTTGKQCR